MPQTHEPGAEAEVDFGEFYAVIAGVSAKCHLFVLPLSASGKAVRVAFLRTIDVAPFGGIVLSRNSAGTRRATVTTGQSPALVIGG